MYRFALPLASLVLANAAMAQTDVCSAPTQSVRFSTQIQPLFDTYCVACHQDASPASALSLQKGTAMNALRNNKTQESDMPLLTPGEPEKSYLYRKLAATHVEAGGGGERMPLAGRMSAANITLVETWIRECAKDTP